VNDKTSCTRRSYQFLPQVTPALSTVALDEEIEMGLDTKMPIQ
jgi:hypothetical protein